MHKVEDAKPSVMCDVDNYVDVAFVLAFASCNQAGNAQRAECRARAGQFHARGVFSGILLGVGSKVLDVVFEWFP